MKALQKGCFENGNNWALFIAPVRSHGIAVAYSDGSVKIFPTTASSTLKPLRVIQAHDSTINGMKAIGDGNLIATCAEDKIKIWDLNSASDIPVRELTNDKASEYISLGFGHGLLAAGTELQGVDAEVHIWDLETGKLVRSFVDSHHDDVTDVKFHPTNKQLLLSGSTDGYVNIYDLSIDDEEDALYQVINHASIHSASFVSPFRISTLSHMETFAIHDLEKDTSEELTNPQPPHDFGDVRAAWDCEYVIDVCPGYVACGSNSRGHLMLYPFDQKAEKVDTDSAILLLGGHGEEVVRAIHVDGENGLIYTGGEDGCFRIWETSARLSTPEHFFQVSNDADVDMDIDSEVEDTDGKKKEKKDKKDKKDKKEKKDKKDKDKKDKKKKKKKKSDVRYKPY